MNNPNEQSVGLLPDEELKRKGVVCSDWLDLCAFLAQYQHDLNTMRSTLIAMTPEAAHEALIMQWPMIQGTRNQMNLTAIGKLPYDLKAVGRAVQAILSNAPVRREPDNLNQ